MTRSLAYGALLGLALVSLSACSDARKALGIDKSPPDEFAVVAGSPLAIPPDFGLRPPRTSTDRPNVPTPIQAARQSVFRVGGQVSSGTSGGASGSGGSAAAPSFTAGEQAILAKSGANNADPGIRARIETELNRQQAANEGFLDSLLWWKDKPDPGTDVDAGKEAQRLRENAALGKPVTAGETPQLQRTERTPLEGIF
jgi:hypothetical protein